MGRHSAAKVPQEIRPSRRNDSHCLTYLMEGGEGGKEGGKEGERREDRGKVKEGEKREGEG